MNMRAILIALADIENVNDRDLDHRSIGNTINRLRMKLIDNGFPERVEIESEALGPGRRYLYTLTKPKRKRRTKNV